jgi:hypothetical protein
VDDAVGIAPLQLLDALQRPELLPRERVVGEPDVAQVPVPASREEREAPRDRRAPARSSGGDRDDADAQRRDRHEEGELGPERKPGGEAGDRDRRPIAQLPARVRLDEEGDRGEHQRQPDDVVVGVARLAGEHQVGRQQDRDGDERDRAVAVGAADAPGGKEGQAQPAEVHQG